MRLIPYLTVKWQYKTTHPYKWHDRLQTRWDEPAKQLHSIIFLVTPHHTAPQHRPPYPTQHHTSDPRSNQTTCTQHEPLLVNKFSYSVFYHYDTFSFRSSNFQFSVLHRQRKAPIFLRKEKKKKGAYVELINNLK